MRHDISRIAKVRRRAFNDDATAADVLQAYEARIVALEQLVGRQALKLEFLRGDPRSAFRPRSGPTFRDHRPTGLGVAEGCRLMAIAGSTCYGRPRARLDDTALVQATAGICGAFEAYGWRRVRAASASKRSWPTTSGSAG